MPPTPRRPLILLAVIMPMLLLGGCLPYALIAGYAFAHAGPIAAVPDSVALMLAIPGCLLAIPLSLLLSNVVMSRIPPLRRRACAYSSAAGKPDFDQAQRDLLQMLRMVAVVCIAIIAIAFTL